MRLKITNKLETTKTWCERLILSVLLQASCTELILSPASYQPTCSPLCPQKTIYPLGVGITISDLFLPPAVHVICHSFSSVTLQVAVPSEPTPLASSFDLLQKCLLS